MRGTGVSCGWDTVPGPAGYVGNGVAFAPVAGGWGVVVGLRLWNSPGWFVGICLSGAGDSEVGDGLHDGSFGLTSLASRDLVVTLRSIRP